MKKLLSIAISALFLSACVSNESVRAVQPSDYNLSCDNLKYELANLGAKFEESKEDSGFTGKNVDLAFTFFLKQSFDDVNISTFDKIVEVANEEPNGCCILS